MKFQRLMPSLVCIAILSACQGTGPVAGGGKPAPTMAAAMAEVDAAVMAGQNDNAYALLKSAGSAHPTDKTPWVRMAQMRFDSADYGQAIVDALGALKLDPEDTLANSIVAVSGLRVTSKALADLSHKNNLSGNVRTEAQELAKLLRSSLGEETLVANGGHAGAGSTKIKSDRKLPPPPPPPRAASNDPFGALK